MPRESRDPKRKAEGRARAEDRPGIRVSRMPSGRAMDVLVAEFVFGWQRKQMNFGTVLLPEDPEGTATTMTWEKIGDVFVPLQPVSLEPYSTSLSSSWKIVERLQGRGVFINYLSNDFYWIVQFESYRPGKANELPLAICRAGLFAVLGVGDVKR